MLLGFVLGPLMEENLRRAMLIAARRLDRLLHPADLGHACSCSPLILLLISVLPMIRKRRDEVFVE